MRSPTPVLPLPRASTRWFSWLIGAAILGAVVVATLHVSEARAFTELVSIVAPGWIVVAAVAQAVTYLSEAKVWRAAVGSAGHPVPLATAYQLAIAKLFVDQAVPTGGLSGTLVYVEGLRRSGVPRGVAISGVIVDTFSYYAAYALCVAVALVIASAIGHLNGAVATVAVIFIIVSTVFAVAVLLQFGRESDPIRRTLGRIALVQRMLNLLRDVDPKLTHRPRLLVRTMAWQVSIQVLDAATIWLLLLALGWTVSPAVVFTSYMFSALFRTISITPGGLGTFEAASLVILRSAGVPIEAAFSATFLFRVLNFWLPMLPGMWLARRVMRSRGRFSGVRKDSRASSGDQLRSDQVGDRESDGRPGYRSG